MNDSDFENFGDVTVWNKLRQQPPQLGFFDAELLETLLTGTDF
jgi:hypothetical protein